MKRVLTQTKNPPEERSVLTEQRNQTSCRPYPATLITLEYFIRMLGRLVSIRGPLHMFSGVFQACLWNLEFLKTVEPSDLSMTKLLEDPSS